MAIKRKVNAMLTPLVAFDDLNHDQIVIHGLHTIKPISADDFVWTLKRLTTLAVSANDHTYHLERNSA